MGHRNIANLSAENWAALCELHPDFQFEVCPLGLADGQMFRNLREIGGGIALESDDNGASWHLCND